MMVTKYRIQPNPIIIKEFRSRMRGGRAFITLTAVLLFLGAVSYLLYRMVQAQLQYSTAPASPQIGQALFSGLAFLELMMICAITPAVTASAISSEKEKLTYEMLVATPLRPASILWGKLISAMGYVFILIFAAIPLFSLVFTFGGVTAREMGKALLVLMIVAVMLGVMGLFFSALLGRSGRATVLSYIVLVLMIFLPYFLYISRNILTQTQAPRELLILSPITALFSAMSPSVNGQYPMSWLYMFGGFGPEMIFGSAPMTFGQIPRPIYHYSLPLYGFFTVVMYLIAMRLVQPARRWKLGLRELLGGLGVLLGYIGLVAIFFYATAGRYENATGVLTDTNMFPPPQEVMVEGVFMSEPAIEVPAYPLPENDQSGIPITPGPFTGLLPEEQALIYVQVIRQLYTIDHTFAETPNFETIYILGVTDDQVGDPNTQMEAATLIPQEVREIILKNLLDLPASIQWVDDLADVPRDPETEAVANNGAIISLGNIHVQEKSIEVPASLEVAPLIAGGRTYLLSQEDNAWQIVGTSGVEWQR